MPKHKTVYRFRVTPLEGAYRKPDVEKVGAFTVVALGSSSLQQIMDAIEEAVWNAPGKVDTGLTVIRIPHTPPG